MAENRYYLSLKKIPMKHVHNITIRSLILLVIVAIFFFNTYSHFDYTPDDTFIYLQYAKNLTQGNGISFNAGELSYGITSPLWLFIISTGKILGFDLYAWAKVIDILLACGALVVFYFTLFCFLQDFAVRVCATIVFSLNVWLIRWAGSGMETSLGIVLLLLAVNYLLRENYFYSSVFTGLLGLVRPEGLLFFIIIAGFIFLVEKKRFKFLVSTSLILAALPIAPWLIYAHFNFGTILPDTALAKAGLAGDIGGSFSTLLDMGQTALFSDGFSILICIFGVALIFYRSRGYKNDPSAGDNPKRDANLRLLIGLGWIIIIPIFYIITDVNFISRYLLLISPLILIYAFYFLSEFLSSNFNSRFLYTGILIFTIAVTLQNQLAYLKVVRPHMDLFAEGMNSALIPIGKWLSLNTPKDSRIFAQDVGAIGYFSDRYICDAAGLISPSLLELQRRGYTHNKMVNERVYNSICKSDYVVYRSPIPEVLKDEPDLVPLITRTFLQMGLSDRQVYYYTVYSVRTLPVLNGEENGINE